MGSNSSKVKGKKCCNDAHHGENQHPKTNILCPHCREEILSQVNEKSLENKNTSGKKNHELKRLNTNESKIHKSDSMVLRNGKKIFQNRRKLHRRKAKLQIDNSKKKCNKTTHNGNHQQPTTEPTKRKAILNMERENGNNLRGNSRVNEQNNMPQTEIMPGPSGIQNNIETLHQNKITKWNENHKDIKGKSIPIKFPVVPSYSDSDDDDD